MNSHCGCQALATQHGLRAFPIRRIGSLIEWIVPTAIFLLIPKCPACVAGYVALLTGLGISLTAAAHVRMLMLALCIAAVTYLAAKRSSAIGLRLRRTARFLSGTPHSSTSLG